VKLRRIAAAVAEAIRPAAWGLAALLIASLAGLAAEPSPGTPDGTRPNILLAIADDWSWPHAGVYGDRTVATPTLDRVAREGVLFTHAFTAAPSCTPSRAAILTGQAIHRLDQGGNLHGFLPKKFPVYPDLLEHAGYYVGHTGKGWGPGRFEPGGRTRNPAGPQFKSFDEFLRQRPAGRPFCFWFGSHDPHRPYEKDSGLRAGLTPETVRVPAFLPDLPQVRSDVLDYYYEVQRFDREVGEILKLLEARGEIDTTLVVITSDNGMPFPRAKANVYDAGTRMPLAIRWPAGIKTPRRVDDFVSLSDLAPTILEVAGLKPPEAMTARSVLGLLTGGAHRGAPSARNVHAGVEAGAPSARNVRAGVEADRDRVFMERERHANVRRGDLSYPMRAIRTREFLYIRNLRPERWPAGDPERYFAVGPFGDVDGSPTKTLLLDRRDDPAIAKYFRLAMAKRPAEELYDLRTDPAQIENVADRPQYAEEKRRLRAELDQWMRETGDPRATSDDNRWDRYPYYGQPAAADTVKGARRPLK
jgi:arylsulfatase A-like enzyme